MSDLRSLQHTMVRAVMTGGMEAIASEFTAGAGSAAARLKIFHNNTFASLTQCLRAVFPVTVQLSDERFFSYAAHEFVTQHPPREARLSTFGEDFPSFLTRFEPCRQFPIIAEMAACKIAPKSDPSRKCSNLLFLIGYLSFERGHRWKRNLTPPKSTIAS
jgi:hypothetical protein